jgi:hypothetical protein
MTFLDDYENLAVLFDIKLDLAGDVNCTPWALEIKLPEDYILLGINFAEGGVNACWLSGIFWSHPLIGKSNFALDSLRRFIMNYFVA